MKLTEELLNTVVNLYKSEIEDNIWFADNILRENEYDGRQSSIIYRTMYSGPHSPQNLDKCMNSSRMFYTLVSCPKRQWYEALIRKQQADEYCKKLAEAKIT